MKAKISPFYFLLAAGILLLLVRLAELQLILGKRNLAIAEGNRIRREVFPAPRGIIFDRRHQPLVRNVPVYRLKKKGCQAKNQAECFEIIDREEALRLEARGGEEAERLRVDVGRDYLYGPALAHVLGYLNWELTGTTGIEEKYDQLLRGQAGGEIYEVDTRGVKIREIDRIEPVPGQDLNLSIDGELSKIAFEALRGKRGAVVATEAKTGRVLVLVSSPSFDPNLLVGVKGRDEEKIKVLLNDPNRPFFNRAIAGVYPPGSTFKIVTAVAGLEEGKIDETTRIEDPGVIKVGAYSYANWYFTKYGKTEGSIGLVRAIQRSTDTFFYKVGEWLGAKSLAQWAKAFGLGQKTGIDLAGEAAGLVPSPDWKEKTTGERWFLGNTYHFAIGQADLLTTPLQINLMMSVIANNGKLCPPQIALTGADRHSLAQNEKSQVECRDLKLKEKTLKLVKEGLRGACSPGGTASIFFNFSPQVACKTGTAEYGNPQGKTHAWLTAFAPAEDPEIVVTALVEGGGEGSVAAAPIVKKVMAAWFAR